MGGNKVNRMPPPVVCNQCGKSFYIDWDDPEDRGLKLIPSGKNHYRISQLSPSVFIIQKRIESIIAGWVHHLDWEDLGTAPSLESAKFHLSDIKNNGEFPRVIYEDGE